MLISQAQIDKLKKFITEGVWQIDTSILPASKKLGFTSLRVLIILIKGFKKDNCTMQAAALTNITLMSMVPMMAFMFAIAKGLGFYSDLEQIINEKVAEYPGVLEVSTQLFTMIEKTNFKALGSIGILLLLWTVISVMSKIENSFNTIWGLSKPRDFLTRCKEYLITVMIVPFALLASASISTALRTGTVAQKAIAFLGDYSIIYDAFLWIVSPCMVALAFCYLYKFLPNTKVRVLPAFLAALITTFLWQFTQYIFVKFQIGISNHNQIYGTFSAIPLFLTWLYMSWMLILFGAELSFSIQNHNTFEDERTTDDFSQRTLLNLSLCMVLSLAKSFFKGEEWRASDFMKKYTIPTRLGHKVTKMLVDGNIIKSVNPIETIYLPAQDLQHMTLWNIYEAIFGIKDPILNNLHDEELKEIMAFNNEKLESYSETLMSHKVYDLVNDE
ncbi:MAG: YihY/virulence factor BrkB family protein [Lentisphaerales bacterium]|nr:YihY/virulence factor BrkB family protein [Lentisphaerales bacterium]